MKGAAAFSMDRTVRDFLGWDRAVHLFFFFQFTLSLGLWVAAIRHFRLGRGFGNRKKTKQYSNVSYGEPQP